MPPERKGIDALPDEVLQHILSFLEAQEFVRTCVLSRRWRNLWKSAPGLRILASKGKFLGSVEKLCDFLDSLLVHRGGAPLDTCELRFSYWTTAVSIVQSIRLEPLVGKWLRHALVCKAQILSLYAHDSGRIDGCGLTLRLYKIPPLNSQHLTRLELGSVLIDNSFLNFSNCPSLEYLKFENCCFGSYGSELGDSRTHICAPNLVSLHLDEIWGLTVPVLESMPSLVKAFVGIGMVRWDSCDLTGNCTCEFYDNSYSIGEGTGSNGGVLLNGLSEAKDLTLISTPETFIFKRDLRWCPTFSKLKTLLLSDYWCVPDDFRALVCLLEHSPVLEKLTLSLSSKVKQQRETNNGNLRPMERSAAILEHLKIIEVRCDVVDERICKLTLFLCAFHIHKLTCYSPCFYISEIQHYLYLYGKKKAMLVIEYDAKLEKCIHALHKHVVDMQHPYSLESYLNCCVG